ncbi:NAD(P)/FAD-dependent oxidoreductase [Cognatiluteimonas weifangensis]|uniref:FAD-dependent oxidoreductase n=1 Tax=Cognatiluteimonas weifangensis TaxID=2303539 RepID=A0A372DJ17_9GAMM|nr:FAD-dependent oxidoreductase [Luteimonas weifangensis]RFP59457.1 FAD-dependent oxidoreductase [Luteimonas weifangensis]
MQHDARDVLVVGGGVIGLACGLALLESGRSVRVLEAGTAGCGSSHGNCGTLTPSHALPLAAPGTIVRALHWMLTPDAPLYLKPRFDPALWSWLLRFAGHCNARDWMRSGAARAALLQASRAAFPDWIASHGIECEFATTGTDHVFRDAAALEEYTRDLAALAELGIASEVIDGAAYAREEPALRAGVVGAVRFPGDASLRPDRYVAGLAQALRTAGGEIVEHCEVRNVTTDGDGVRVATALGDYRGRDVVLAVGAWSPRLARALTPGLPLLARAMQPGKGYSITYDRPALVPRRPLTLHERSVCVSIWGSGYRLGSTMEFSGFDASLNRRRLDALERAAHEYLHEGVGPVRCEEWCGWRPMSVDDVPLLGPVPGRAHQWLATGHGMLGVSMSPGTAQLLADLVCGRTPAFDPAPYRPDRFA